MKFRSLQLTFPILFAGSRMSENLFANVDRTNIYIRTWTWRRCQSEIREGVGGNGAAMARATRSRGVQDTRVRATRIGSVLVARQTAKWPPTTVEAHTNDASTRTRFRNETACACGCVHATRAAWDERVETGGKKRRKKKRERERERENTVRSCSTKSNSFFASFFFFLFIRMFRDREDKSGISYTRLISATFVQSEIVFFFFCFADYNVKCHHEQFLQQFFYSDI